MLKIFKKKKKFDVVMKINSTVKKKTVDEIIQGE